jgi:hypothetical protein
MLKFLSTITRVTGVDLIVKLQVEIYVKLAYDRA